MYIYCITSPSGKKYVGQTTRTVGHRWRQHQRSAGCRALHAAIEKYGAENMIVETLEECASIEELNEREAFWIKELGTLAPNGYNLETGGRNGLPSDETRRLLSAMNSRDQKGEKNSFYGKRHSERSKIKMSESTRPMVMGERNPFYGRHHAEETRKRLSELAKTRTGKANPNYGNHKLAGSNNPSYKGCDAVVMAYLDEHGDGESVSEISRRTGVSRPTVKTYMERWRAKQNDKGVHRV